MSIQTIQEQAEIRMKKGIEALHNEMGRIRTGRASAGLLDSVHVNYHGNEVPLSQVANVAVSDARTLTVTPWEKNIIGAIEKAIIAANLGLNPANRGNVIWIPLPALTEERRKELIRVVKAEGENSKVAIRNIRRDANTELKNLLKEKLVTEDEERRTQDNIQKLTDKYIAEVDLVLSHKEKDLMEI